MGIEVRIEGNRFGIMDLVEDAFTQDNLDHMFPPNDTLNEETTPKGVLGGSVAGLHGDLLAGKADATHRPIGLFLVDAQDFDFVGTSAAGSGKLTVLQGMGIYEVDIYETRNCANSQDLVYSAGDNLFSSERGFLTTEPGAGFLCELIAVCVKAPTTADSTMWLALRI